MALVKFIVRPALHVLPVAWAAALVRRLASRTQRPPVTPAQAAALARAQPVWFGPAGRHAAYAWGQGPLVVLAHGWNGRAAQMAPLAQALAQHGYRCVAYDATGHGGSPGHHTSWACLIDDAAALQRALGGDVLAWIGHSAGGLAAMAARAVHGLRARHHVCVCAPSHPHPPIRAVRQRLDPPEPVLDAYRAMLAQPFGTPWPQLEAGHAFAGAGAELLLVYDQADRFVDHTDGDRILAWCPGATLVKTPSHGHTRILAAPELADTIARFIGMASLASPAQPDTRADALA